ncbi:SDR family NAD(P)-dependent oxidoreductase [Streptomyces sp. NPDC088747]|uniref:SDR family NAD(P)-dependent oxidoreductase n=1 Tax=Streptomyces sp. NPDC088747 TaxID=3365886 RepID=UPI003829E9FB
MTSAPPRSPVTGILDGKATLILGASRGIGAAAAQHFAEQGARLVIGARTLSAVEALRDRLRAQGHEVVAVRADVTDPAEVADAVAATVTAYGRMDAAFNNAGYNAAARFHEHSERDYDDILAVNLKGVFIAMQHQIRAMLDSGGGAIVNTASVSGFVGNYGIAPYIAAKHGVIGLTKAAAFEYAHEHIRVNAIAPGSTATEMLVEGVKRTSEDIVRRFTTWSPMDRMADPAEIPPAAAWLLSDQASFVTGTTLAVDGGALAY